MALGLYLLSRMDAHTSYADDGARHARARHRHRAVHAGADDHRAEHRRLPRPRRRDLRGDVLPHPRQLVRRRDLRHGLLQRPRATRCPAPSRPCPASTRAPIATPKALHAHPAEQIAPIVDAYAHAIHVVFLAAVPVALRRRSCWRCSSRRCRCATRPGPGAATSATAFGMPEGADSAQQLQIAIARLFRRRGREASARSGEASGTELDVGDGWCVGQVHVRARLGRDSQPGGDRAAGPRARRRCCGRPSTRARDAGYLDRRRRPARAHRRPARRRSTKLVAATARLAGRASSATGAPTTTRCSPRR